MILMKILKNRSGQKWFLMVKRLIETLVSSPNPDEDKNRREIILNIIFLVSIAGFMILNVIRVADYFIYPEIEGLPLWTTFLILFFFCALLRLSKRGRAKTAAWFLIAIYSAPMFYCFIVWGTDLPSALLLAVLIITLSGILISERLVLIMTGLISLALIGITIGQQRDLIPVQSYWRDYPTALGDIIAYAVLLIIAAFIAWLFGRSISRALDRARQSEKALKEERDSLEIKVVERTAELRQAEAEKINQLYRLAEFGRLSSGIFHDLINPLTAVSLNLEQIKDQSENKISNAKSYLGQALIATRKMEDLISSIKRQLQRKSQRTEFSVNEEIGQVIQILAYKARRADVKILWTASEDIRMLGDAVKFSQIIINLLANSIEACEGKTDGISDEKNINIKSGTEGEDIIITVSDHGEGIAPENLDKIFLPFFSTKRIDNRGLGLGLASTKSIVEKDFGGQITVTSQLGIGTKFFIRLPKSFVGAIANN